MNIETKQVELRILRPDEGKYLYNGETIAEGEIYLGNADSPENWREITEEEKKEIENAEESNV